MSAERLPWHEPQWSHLERMAAAERIPHALLLRGVAGLGKVAFAARLAAWLLCEGPRELWPCGECRGCRLQAAGNHPDMYSLVPAEDRRTISVEQIRELIARLALTSGYGGYQVITVVPAEAMTHAAANTLLKTLEEPSGSTAFILVADRSALLPATVRSRCQIIDFGAPEAATARAWLRTRVPDDADSDALLAMAGGAPLRALALAETNAVAEHATLLQELTALASGRADAIAVAERWRDAGSAETVGALLALVTDLVRLKSGASEDRLGHGYLMSAMQGLAGRLDLNTVFVLLRELEELQRAQARRLNVNAQLSLEAIAVGWRRQGRR